MTWDEAFADRYEQWSAHMTADVAFYVELARHAEGSLIEFAARRDGERQDQPVPHTIRYSVGDNRVDIVLDDGRISSLWWATKNEWLGLLDVAGLECKALYDGNCQRRPASGRRHRPARVAMIGSSCPSPSCLTV
jgi:hypothetical protein